MTEPHYTRTAITLHWLIAGLIFATLFLGWTMTEMSISPQKLKNYNYHKWLGVTILALSLLRLVWRLTHRAPPLPKMPRWQQFAAKGGHGLLYILMIAMPLTGWIYSNYSGYPVVYLGKIPLPVLVDRDKEMAAAWVQVHGNLAILLAVVVGGHVLAALQHQFIVKDGTMRRMLAWRPRKSGELDA